MRILALTTAFVFMCQAAHAEGPFGITMGSQIASLDTSETGPKVTLNSVPKPHPQFDMYSVWNSDETGVCLILAFSTMFENDRSGRNIRISFDKFAEALDKKYGNRTKYDQHFGGIWKESDEWVMSIRQNERVFGAAWETPPADAENIAHVEMQVLALSSDTSVIKLIYQSTEFDACEKAIDAGADSSF